MSGSPSRAAAGWIVALLVGVLVFAIAAGRPASAAHGSVLTGPKAPRFLVLSPLAPDYRVSWTRSHRAILLLVRDGERCRPAQPRETSTAPARIEVRVLRSSAPACAAAPRWWPYELALPTVVQAGQGVAVWVDGTAGSVPRYEATAVGRGSRR